MSSETKLISGMVKHQVFVQRFGGGQWNDLKSYIDDLKKEVGQIVQSADFLNSSPRYQNQLVNNVNAAIVESLDKFQDSMLFNMEDFAEYEIGFYQKMIAGAVKSTAVLSAPTIARNQLRAAIESNMLNVEPGRQMTMREALRQFSNAQTKRIQQTLRDGFIQGATVQDMTKVVSDNLATTTRQSETIVRTATNATSQLSRDLFYDENPDVIVGYRWVSTLDGRTSPICQVRDGEVYRYKSDPRPPAHYNCRSTTVPEIADQYNLSTGRETRSSADGQVSARTTYDGWLRDQSVDVQNEVLGVSRAKAFRSGGYSIDRFVDDTGRYYTLDELKQKDLLK